MPVEFADLELCMEWGITYQEFMDTPAEVVGKLREYLSAKSEGMRRKEAAAERDRILNQQTAKKHG